MSKIYQSDNAENRYEKTDLGQRYNPQKAASNENATRQWKERIVQDGRTKQRELDREIQAQNLTTRLTQGVERAGLGVQQDAANAQLAMQQKYDTNILKQEHQYEQAQMKLDMAEFRAQGQVDAANLKATSTAVTGILSFGGKYLNYLQENEEVQQQKEREDAVIDSISGGIDDLTPATVETFNQEEGARAAEDNAVETAINNSSDDPAVQDSIRQETTAPRTATENVRRGNAYSAAEDFGGFWQDWTNDLDITYTRKDGTQFTSATARDRSDLLQIANAAKRAFFKAAGLGDLPRAQVAQVLGPLITRTSASWVDTRTEGVVAGNQAAAIESATLNATDGLSAGDNVGSIFQTLSSQLFGSGAYNGNRSKANEDAVKEILNWAVRNNRPDVIEALAKAPKIVNADGTPQKGTSIGRQYGALIEEAREGVVNEVISDEKRVRDLANTQVIMIERDLIGALADTDDPVQERELNLAAADALEALGTPESEQAAAELRGNPNYSPFTSDDIAERQANGETYTNDELGTLVQSGDITAAEAKELGWNPKGGASADTARTERVKGFNNELKAVGNAAVTAALSGPGGDALNADDKRLELQGKGASIVADIQDRLAEELSLELAANPDLTDAEVRQFIRERGADLAKEVTYTVDGGLSYEFGPKGEGGNRITTTQNPSTGDVVMDVRNVPAGQIDSQLIPDPSEAAVLTTRELAIANAAIGTGKPLPPWLEEKAAALGTNAETLLRSQNQFYGEDTPTPPAPPQERSRPTRVSGGGSSSSPELAQYDTGETFGSVSLDNLRNAVISKESAGRMDAVNPDSGALGYGQVMPANVESWSKAALGYSISPREFLRNPDLQMRIINDRFRKMMQSQAAAGYSGDILIRRVASIWYSGQAGLYNNSRPQPYGGNVYPSIASYTMDVVGRYRNG